MLEPTFRQLFLDAVTEFENEHPDARIKVVQTHRREKQQRMWTPRVFTQNRPTLAKKTDTPLPPNWDPINLFPSMGLEMTIRVSSMGDLPFDVEHPLFYLWPDWAGIVTDHDLVSGMTWARQQPSKVQMTKVNMAFVIKTILRSIRNDVSINNLIDKPTVDILKRYAREIDIPTSHASPKGTLIHPAIWERIWKIFTYKRYNL